MSTRSYMPTKKKQLTSILRLFLARPRESVCINCSFMSPKMVPFLGVPQYGFTLG